MTGGAKNFKLDGRKKEAFKTGLISAARYIMLLINVACDIWIRLVKLIEPRFCTDGHMDPIPKQS